jgi:hypothetical protein
MDKKLLSLSISGTYRLSAWEIVAGSDWRGGGATAGIRSLPLGWRQGLRGQRCPVARSLHILVRIRVAGSCRLRLEFSMSDTARW